MRALIPALNISQYECCEQGIEQQKKILLDKLNIKLNFHVENTQSFADLLDPIRCKNILQDFALRTKAINLTCASSMFMKYWGVPLLFPYFYAVLTRQFRLPWHLSLLSVDLEKDWHWDRHLIFKKIKMLSDVIDIGHDNFIQTIDRIFSDLNLIFNSISKVGKVQKYLLWENTALRILQFYDFMQKNHLDDQLTKRIVEQRGLLCLLPANYFGLKVNPFYVLEQSRKNSSKQYKRKKCCFYFQLPESNQEFCSSCPLMCKKDEEIKL